MAANVIINCFIRLSEQGLLEMENRAYILVFCQDESLKKGQSMESEMEGQAQRRICTEGPWGAMRNHSRKENSLFGTLNTNFRFTCLS